MQCTAVFSWLIIETTLTTPLLFGANKSLTKINSTVQITFAERQNTTYAGPQKWSQVFNTRGEKKLNQELALEEIKITATFIGL